MYKRQSYNDAETISTLRFGVRAKSIKNNAKVNAELSPAELKAQLKKIQAQMATFEEYISNLESELGKWRRGESVPKDQWLPSVKSGVKAAPRPGTPSTLPERRASQAPGTPRTESRMDDRASTPNLPIEKDERDEFLRRENELEDQLAEKGSALETVQKDLDDARAELKDIRENHSRSNKDSERMTGEVETLKMQIERITFETKEATITMDSLKEANVDLTNELDEVRKELLEAKMSARETSAVLDEKEKLKKERMAQMMAGFDLGSEVFSEDEGIVTKSIDEVERLAEMLNNGEAIAPDALQSLRQMLLDTQGAVRQSELQVNGSNGAGSLALQNRLAEVQTQYQELLEKNLTEADIEDVKSRLQSTLTSQANGASERELQETLDRQQEDNNRLRNDLENLRRQNLNGANGSKTLHQQLADFDAMKKSLMRDLQNRCERVVELEISLDNTRESYNQVLRSANSKQQQKKLAFLERNLEQLTLVQRQLVEQNAQLKKEVAIADRKLVARGERIRGLEGLLAESQEKLLQANHRYVCPDIRISDHNQYADIFSSFELQISQVKERLEAARAGSTRNLTSPGGFAGPMNGGPVGGQGGPFGSRIAKPLRGGGGGDGGAPVVPTFASLQAQAQANAQAAAGDGGKRGSWFFNQRT